jgi:hypothetical protein
MRFRNVIGFSEKPSKDRFLGSRPTIRVRIRPDGLLQHNPHCGSPPPQAFFDAVGGFDAEAEAHFVAFAGGGRRS